MRMGRTAQMISAIRAGDTIMVFARREDEHDCECASEALSRQDCGRRSRGIGLNNVLLAD
jgi:hypothetical protein